MQLFVSYSRRDEAPVRKLIGDLERAHLSVWHDRELRGGDPWWQDILRRIRECDVFVLALSENSLASKPCLAELSYARALGLPVLPVLIGPVGNLRIIPVADLHIVDYRERTLDSGLALIGTLQALGTERNPLPDPLPEPPGIPFAYLLRLGSAIVSAELTPADQGDYIRQLRECLETEEDEAVKEDARELLRALRRRSDVTHRHAQQIDQVLSDWADREGRLDVTGDRVDERISVDSVLTGGPGGSDTDSDVERKTVGRVEGVGDRAVDPPPRRPVLLALTLLGLVAVIALWAVLDRIGYAIEALSVAVSVGPPLLGAVSLFLVGPSLLPVGRRAGALAVASGLVVGAALSLTNFAASFIVEGIYYSATPGKLGAALFLAWGIVASAGVLVLAHPLVAMGVAFRRDWRILYALLVILFVYAALMRTGLEGWGSWPQTFALINLVQFMVIALVLTLLRLSSLQRLVGLVAATVFGGWVVYWVVRQENFPLWEILTVGACYLAQLESRQGHQASAIGATYQREHPKAEAQS